jgi:uncharacterized protein (TIRG00374 family)
VTVSSRFKTILQYAIIFAITFLLIGLSLRGLKGENKLEYLNVTWQSANKGWLLIMAVIAMLSHLVRAARWRMLMGPAGYAPSLANSFYSLMVGYLVNLVIPRGGEVSRCYNLYKLEKVPVDMSFGTVVVERIIDLLCLLALIVISFAVESQKLFAFVETLPINLSNSTNRLQTLLYIVVPVLMVGAFAIWFVKRNERVMNFIRKTWYGFREGLLSVFRLENKAQFIFYSAAIWLLYFLMSYTVLKAFPSTAELGFGAVLSLFAIGSIAMAVPLPGGTGSYHLLVPQGLVFLYHVNSADATAFTFIFHGWQTAIMILAGAISLLLTSYQVKREALISEEQ